MPACPLCQQFQCLLVRQKSLAKELTDIGRLDHTDVITTVANAADRLSGVRANESSNICLLRRRAAAGDDHRQLRCDLDKVILVVVNAELHVSVRSQWKLTCMDSPSMTKQQSSFVRRNSSTSRACSGVLTCMSAQSKEARTFSNLVDVLVPRH